MEFRLIIKKINNTLSSEEKQVFNQWYQESSAHRSYFNRVKNYDSSIVESIDVEKSWIELNKKLLSGQKRNINLWQKFGVWKYVAAIAIFILATSPFIFNTATQNNNGLKRSAKNIKPGADKAILTLENGDHVALERGKVHEFDDRISDGKRLIYDFKKIPIKRKTVRYNYLTIPRGGEYYVILSDGTKIWLNSDSKLRYPVNFTKGEVREVELIYGEAYFDVSPSINHDGAKFRVHCNNQTIEVLGTRFNVRAYQNEDKLYTTLVEGKILVSSSTHEEFLDPGQQSILAKNDNTSFDVVSLEDKHITDEVAWKSGFFSFDKKPLGDVLNILSRWYDIDVEFESESKRNMAFSGYIKRAEAIEDLLIIFQKTGRVKFKINDKKITVK